jgi:hypothetical protein
MRLHTAAACLPPLCPFAPRIAFHSAAPLHERAGAWQAAAPPPYSRVPCVRPAARFPPLSPFPSAACTRKPALPRPAPSLSHALHGVLEVSRQLARVLDQPLDGGGGALHKRTHHLLQGGSRGGHGRKTSRGSRGSGRVGGESKGKAGGSRVHRSRLRGAAALEAGCGSNPV